MAVEGKVKRLRLYFEDKDAVGEMETFVRAANGRFEAAPQCHDDDVLALAMGRF